MKRLLLSIGLLLPLSATAADVSRFPDVPDVHPQVLAINYVAYEGIMSGYPNGTFGPANPLNRAELMKVLVHSAFGEPGQAYARSCFPDVAAGDWFAPSVCYAAEHGWVKGYPDGKFRPSQPVTMAEAIKMLVASRSYPLDAPVSWQAPDIPSDAWYAPYLAVGLDKFIVSFEGLSDAQGHSVLGQALDRGTIAEYLYRADVAEDKVSLSARDDANTCAGKVLVGVSLVNQTINTRDGTPVIMQPLWGILEDRSHCLLATNLNPYFGVSPHLSNYILFPLEPDGIGKGENSAGTGFGKAGKVWFMAGHQTSGYLSTLWELDMKDYSVRQLPSAARLTMNISRDYDHMAYITADGRSVVAINPLDNDHRSTVYTANGVLTLAAGITEFGGMPHPYAKDEDLTFDPVHRSVVKFRVYDKRHVLENGSYDPAFSVIQTVDLSSSR
jgi:hypothetical protein